MTKEELAALIAAKESEIEANVVLVKDLYEARDPKLLDYRDYTTPISVASDTLDYYNEIDHTVVMLNEFKAQAESNADRPGFRLYLEEAYSYENDEDIRGNCFVYEYLIPKQAPKRWLVNTYILSLLGSNKYAPDCYALLLFLSGVINWDTLVSLHSPCKV